MDGYLRFDMRMKVSGQPTGWVFQGVRWKEMSGGMWMKTKTAVKIGISINEEDVESHLGQVLNPCCDEVGSNMPVLEIWFHTEGGENIADAGDPGI